MVEVRLVGFEGGIALGHTTEHHAEGITYRHSKNGKRERYDAELLAIYIIIPLCVMVVTKHLDDVPRHEDTHGHGASIADEHLGSLAKDIVDKERKQGTSKHKGKHSIGVVVRTIHSYAKHQAKGDAEATGKSIHTIDHVHGVDDAYTSEDGEGYAYPPRETLDAPQSMQTVDTGSIADDDSKHGEDFNDDSIAG